MQGPMDMGDMRPRRDARADGDERYKAAVIWQGLIETRDTRPQRDARTGRDERYEAAERCKGLSPLPRTWEQGA